MKSVGQETRKNPIRFKNALAEAKVLLDTMESAPYELLTQLAELEKLCETESIEFWQHQEEGLVLYLDGVNTPLFFGLPFSPTSKVSVDDTPNLTPLRRLTDSNLYYILSLDLNQIRLFQATRWSAEEIELANVPTSLDEAMKYDDPEESIQFRAVSKPGKGGSADLAFHGHGGTGDENRQRQIDRFFEMVAGDLADNFEDRNTPLILLGPSDLTAVFQAKNKYETLSEKIIDLNPSSTSDGELKEKIHDAIARWEGEDLTEKLNSIPGAIAQDQGSTNIAEIVCAAAEGRVQDFFYKEGASISGTFDEKSFKAHTGDGESNLVAVARKKAIDTGANVRVVSREEDMPDGADVAAIYRY